jgi:tetratricopeptide (TPR) repeat protein
VKALDYLEKAGDQALHGGAFQEAVEFFSRAFEVEEQAGIAVDEVRRALREKGLATAHYFLGDLQSSRALLRQAVARLHRPVPSRALRLTLALMAAIVRQLAHHALRSRYFERRRADAAVLEEAVDCYKVLGQINYLNGDSAVELSYLTIAGLNLGEEAGPSAHLARTLIHAATLTSLLGLTKASDGYAERAVRMAEEEGQYEADAYVWHIAAIMQCQRGDYQAAKAANSRALELVREVGDNNLEGEVWQVRAAVNIGEGDVGAAEVSWARTREFGERNGNPQLMCWSLMEEVTTQHARGRTEAAARALEAGLAIPTAETDGQSRIEKYHGTAVTRLREGSYEEAVAAADAVVDMLDRGLPTTVRWGDVGAGALEVYLELLEEGGEYAEAHRRDLRRRARRAAKILRRISRQFWHIRARTAFLRGLLLWERGRRRRALRAWRKAERIALEMGVPSEVARARFEIARHGCAGDDRETYLAEAAETFRRLGADHLLRRAEAACS